MEGFVAKVANHTQGNELGFIVTAVVLSQSSNFQIVIKATDAQSAVWELKWGFKEFNRHLQDEGNFTSV
jgi:hypothetical protein